MRLTRGADGTYSYQYVADEQKISEAQERLITLNQELYNLDVDQYESQLQKFYDAYDEFVAQLQQKAAEGATAEELEEFINKNREYFATIAETAGIASDNLEAMVQDTAAKLGSSINELTVGTGNALTGTIQAWMDALVGTEGQTGLLTSSFATLATQMTNSANTFYDEMSRRSESFTQLVAGADGQGGMVQYYTNLAKAQDTVITNYNNEATILFLT